MICGLISYMSPHIAKVDPSPESSTDTTTRLSPVSTRSGHADQCVGRVISVIGLSCRNDWEAPDLQSDGAEVLILVISHQQHWCRCGVGSWRLAVGGWQLVIGSTRSLGQTGRPPCKDETRRG